MKNLKNRALYLGIGLLGAGSMWAWKNTATRKPASEAPVQPTGRAPTACVYDTGSFGYNFALNSAIAFLGQENADPTADPNLQKAEPTADAKKPLQLPASATLAFKKVGADENGEGTHVLLGYVRDIKGRGLQPDANN